MSHSSIGSNTMKTDQAKLIFSSECPTLMAGHVRQLHSGSGISIKVTNERGYETILGEKRLADLSFSHTVSNKYSRCPGGGG